jgi:hypothetical protein
MKRKSVTGVTRSVVGGSEFPGISSEGNGFDGSQRSGELGEGALEILNFHGLKRGLLEGWFF